MMLDSVDCTISNVTPNCIPAMANGPMFARDAGGCSLVGMHYYNIPRNKMGVLAEDPVLEAWKVMEQMAREIFRAKTMVCMV